LRIYESIIVFHPEATDEARREVQDKAKAVVERSGGEVQAVDDWGKRKLAYVVRKQRYGLMTRLQMNAPPTVVNELDQVYRHAESIIKYMTAGVTAALLKQKAADALAPPVVDSAENGRRRR
jgi:small subunit ribosomal protein S6